MPSILVKDLTLYEMTRLKSLKQELGGRPWRELIPDAFEALARERLMKT